MSIPSERHGLAISPPAPSPAPCAAEPAEPMGKEEQGWDGISSFVGPGWWDQDISIQICSLTLLKLRGTIVPPGSPS